MKLDCNSPEFVRVTYSDVNTDWISELAYLNCSTNDPEMRVGACVLDKILCNYILLVVLQQDSTLSCVSCSETLDLARDPNDTILTFNISGTIPPGSKCHIETCLVSESGRGPGYQLQGETTCKIPGLFNSMSCLCTLIVQSVFLHACSHMHACVYKLQ